MPYIHQIIIMDFLFLTEVPVCSVGTFQRFILERGFPRSGYRECKRKARKNFGKMCQFQSFFVYVFALWHVHWTPVLFLIIVHLYREKCWFTFIVILPKEVIREFKLFLVDPTLSELWGHDPLILFVESELFVIATCQSCSDVSHWEDSLQLGLSGRPLSCDVNTHAGVEKYTPQTSYRAGCASKHTLAWTVHKMFKQVPQGLLRMQQFLLR